MSVPMVFVISAPRSGSTMLERMLESHSAILGGPEPHLLTPLAHLGVWDKVDKAPYDHILAAEAQRLFVSKLPNGEADYWAACRAYCDRLYGASLEGHNATWVLDKTPAYALVLPFMAKVFPDAKYVVLTRHPLAVFSSFANSFFDGSYETAQKHNPILNRYVPAIAQFLRAGSPTAFHVRYEDLVQDPEKWMADICAYIGIPFEPAMVNYGEQSQSRNEGLGDPIGVQAHTRPQAGSVNKWTNELAGDPAKEAFVRAIVDQLNPADCATWGYPMETFWAPLDAAHGTASAPKKAKITRYTLQRKLIVNLRGFARKNGAFRKLLTKARLVCDVLLRE